jgi:hypothetical protein
VIADFNSEIISITCHCGRGVVFPRAPNTARKLFPARSHELCLIAIHRDAVLKYCGAWSVDAEGYGIAFLRTKSKGGDDDCGTLVCKWCSFATKAQGFNFRQVIKKTQTEQATCIIFKWRVP